jgi:hypothetical protein
MLIDGEVEEGVERILALRSGDRRDVLPGEVVVLRELRLLHDHQVPALGERRVGTQRRLDLGPQRLADLGVAVGAQLVCVGTLEDGQPCRHAAKYLAVPHGEPVDDASRIAERDRADTLPRRVLDVGQVRAPAPRLARLLEQGVVHDRPAAGLRDPAQEPILQLGIGPAAALNHAGTDLAENIGQREELWLRCAGGGNALPGDVEVVHVPRDRESQGPRFQSLADDPPHDLELGAGGRAIGAVLAHGIEPDGRVAHQRADIHAEPAPDGGHVVRERLPRPRHAGLEHVHRYGLDVREHPGELLAGLGLDRRQGERAVADDHGGGAVVAGVGAQGIPRHLGVVVAVIVDEARRDDPPVRLDDLARGAPEAPQLRNLPPGHGDVAVEGGPPRAIDDASVLDEQVVTHAVAPFAGSRWAAPIRRMVAHARSQG